MRKALIGAAAASALLAGCQEGSRQYADESVDVELMEAAPAAPVMDAAASAPSGPGSGATPVVAPSTAPNVAPSIAYAYRFGLELPAEAATSLMAKHEQACIAAGASACQVIGSNSSRVGRDSVEASLEMRATPAYVARFRAALDGEARGAGGRVAQQSVESEDLTRQLVDTEARMRAMETLRDRLQQLLATRSGPLEQLLQVERELARVQGELDATRSALTVMRTRVQTSRLDVTYRAAGQLAPDSALRPVTDALGQAAYLFMSTLGALIMLLAGALPLLLVIAPLAWLGWRWRQKRGAQRRAAEAARKKKAEGDPSA
ncbi:MULTISPECIES: DUF4349 domain-containing protein [unclassified Brevundimonas]|uniref:DUF4349 domain-containing protein n=1 Tax=unclassified Brevundimonas TaxID=2622653 RepID=UPI000CFD3878|nr:MULTISPECIES: DUF4349 domain-containing protein [unclassified Brevundimonas]PRA29994.1 hypothetical protein CQ024_08380 [Brevundimonas sp. MYb27]PQZ80848.1 hypothetical protein CQ026_10650 [Brevundimonas sp. MYb31]PRB14051.1 hypothetical protein CQ039_11145 [Brevundimonas sp. MYb52]PRB33316.1 hypothetical protein CQ035_13715 [Brevundimonas sp. MYb46]PRB50808.1 hypothetical protein CQ028_07430 [Brevundimonas sp. MYb33]